MVRRKFHADSKKISKRSKKFRSKIQIKAVVYTVHQVLLRSTILNCPYSNTERWFDIQAAVYSNNNQGWEDSWLKNIRVIYIEQIWNMTMIDSVDGWCWWVMLIDDDADACWLWWCMMKIEVMAMMLMGDVGWWWWWWILMMRMTRADEWWC